MKMTASPGAMEVTPFKGTALELECELSSIFQPVRSMVEVLVLVTSNQSAESGATPLDQGAISEITMLPGTTACVTLSVKPTVASGDAPTPGSSTAMVTVSVGFVAWLSEVPALRKSEEPTISNDAASVPVTVTLF